MTALMPPRHDLRGPQKSANSLAMSSSIFVVSMNRCFFAAENCEFQRRGQYPLRVHELGPISTPLAVGRRFFRTLDMAQKRLLGVQTRVVLVVDGRGCDAVRPMSLPRRQIPRCRNEWMFSPLACQVYEKLTRPFSTVGLSYRVHRLPKQSPQGSAMCPHKGEPKRS